MVIQFRIQLVHNLVVTCLDLRTSCIPASELEASHRFAVMPQLIFKETAQVIT